MQEIMHAGVVRPFYELHLMLQEIMHAGVVRPFYCGGSRSFS